MVERLGGGQPLFDTASLYGTADGGVLGNETPLSIAVRRFLADRPEAARAVFGQDRLPTLVQYDPMSRFFEAVDGALVFSGDNGIPLVRYGILDTGGVVPFEAMMATLAGLGFDPLPLLEGGIARPMPFAYVFGRSDFTVSFHGANVFPENVTVGLEQPGVREWVTGKFVLEVRHDAALDEHLAVVVELAPGETASPARQEAAARSIEEHLCRLNSEYRSYVPEGRRTPRVYLEPAASPVWFPPGVKHRYTRRPG
jgi:phenylacetate-CoA ligase